MKKKETKKKTVDKDAKKSKETKSLDAVRENDIRLRAKESAKWLLAQNAVKKSGEQVELYGKELNNMDVVLAGLLQSGSQGNVPAAMNLLTISGVLGDEPKGETEDDKIEKEASKLRFDRQMKNIKQYIVKKLKTAGVWDDTITYAAEIAAINILLYRKLANEVLPDYQSLVEVETSREGAPRKKASPLLGELQRQMERAIMSLRELTMTVRSGKPKEDNDGFKSFVENFKGDDD